MPLALIIVVVVGLAFYASSSTGSGRRSGTGSGSPGLATDVQLTGGAVGRRIFVKDTVGIGSGQDGGGRATELVTAAGNWLTSLFSFKGFITGCFQVIGQFINLMVSDQKLLEHGRAGAVDDLVGTAIAMRDNVRQQAQALGVPDDKGSAVALAFAWTCATAYNDAAYKYVANYDSAGGLEGIGRNFQSEADHENYWADRALFVPAAKMAELSQPPVVQTVHPSVYLPNITVQVTVGADPRLFNDGKNFYPAQAVQNAGSYWDGELYQFASVLGVFLWCSHGLLHARDNAWLAQGGSWPTNYGGWLLFNHGDPAQQAWYWYCQLGILNPNDFYWSDVDKAVHHKATGLIWLAEASWQNKLPQISWAAPN